ncbi:MAG: cell division protein ZipA [Oceanospirillaceae bacterium]|nr:cell division protein ZipA [Oceanospirillaceae bacterium]MCP5351232.1 cell division protein ZipA [Oceanospirillaceae bacterium]
MDLSLHSFILVIGLLVMAYIIFDGVKKMRASRRERIDFAALKKNLPADDYFSAELPNGGARIATKRAEKAKPLSLDDELLDELPVVAPAYADDEETDDFFARPAAAKPAFINPVIIEKKPAPVAEKPTAVQVKATPVQERAAPLEKAIEVQEQAAPVQERAAPQPEKPASKMAENDLLKSVIRQTDALKSALVKPEVKETPRTEPVLSAADDFDIDTLHAEIELPEPALTEIAEEPAPAPAVEQKKPALNPLQASLQNQLKQEAAKPAKPVPQSLKVEAGEAVPMLMDSVKLGDGIVDQFIPKQQEIDWDAPAQEPHTETQAEEIAEQVQEEIAPEPEIDPAFAVSENGERLSLRAPAEEVIVIHVLANAGEMFDGAKLKHIFKACDMRFGEMDIFHRFEQANASGKIQFSVANAVKPGTFNLHDMQDIQTPGLSFFMSLPGPEKALEAFDTLYQVAQVVAKNLGGELHDETHSDLTPQTLEHYRQRIADFTRKRRLNKSLK